MPRQCLQLLASLALVLTTDLSVFGKCGPTPSPKEALNEAAAVFSGKVAKFGAGVAIFAVDRVWKGVEQRTIAINTKAGKKDYRISFKVGESYMVYARKVDGSLSTNTCTRTKLLEQSVDDIKELGAGMKVETEKH